jgi:hypothetical protein
MFYWYWLRLPCNKYNGQGRYSLCLMAFSMA